MYQHWLWMTFQSTWPLRTKKRVNTSQVTKITIKNIRIRIKLWPTRIKSNSNIAKVPTQLRWVRIISKWWAPVMDRIILLMATVKIKTKTMTRAWNTLRITTKSSSYNKAAIKINCSRVQTATKWCNSNRWLRLRIKCSALFREIKALWTAHHKESERVPLICKTTLLSISNKLRAIKWLPRLVYKVKVSPLRS